MYNKHEHPLSDLVCPFELSSCQTGQSKRTDTVSMAEMLKPSRKYEQRFSSQQYYVIRLKRNFRHQGEKEQHRLTYFTLRLKLLCFICNRH